MLFHAIPRVGAPCVAVAFVGLVGALGATGCAKKVEPAQPTRVAVPRLATQAGINTPARCGACHPNEVAAWKAGGHSRSLRLATTDTVGMPVPGTMVAPDQFGTTTRLEGDRMLMACLDADGATRDFPVTHVIGGSKLEMYVTSYGPDQHPQVLPAMWTNRESQFLPYWAIDLKREPKPVPHGSDRFWTQRQRNFVVYCNRCHSPDTTVTFDPDTAHYTVDWRTPAHLGVQCAACHGDATRHVTDAEQGLAEPALPSLNPRPDQRAVAEVEACGWCHVSGEWLDLDYRPGKPFFDSFMPLVLDDTLHFWPDGRYRDHAYLYLAHEMSRCFQRGALRCTDCHDLHGDRDAPAVRQRSVNACARCHEPKSLPVACESHSGQAPDDPDRPDCLACHMPAISIERGHGVMHDHRIAVPDPALTRLAQIPNACDDCHDDRTADWTEASFGEWKAKVPWRRAPAMAIHQALNGDPWPAMAALQATVGDTALPWPIRATAARLLAKTPHADSATVLIAALRDPHPMVRAGAAFGCLSQPGNAMLPALRACATDPRRVVRVMASASLIFRGEAHDTPAALAEIEAVVAAVPDQLNMHKLLAIGWERAGDLDKARAAHERIRAMVPREPAARAAFEAFEARAKASNAGQK